MVRTPIQVFMDELSRQPNFRESDYAHQYYLWCKKIQRNKPDPATYAVDPNRASEIEQTVLNCITKE